MKKIMFDDEILMPAVLNGTKTMTRRFVTDKKAVYTLDEQEFMDQLCVDYSFCERYSRYKLGEVVAIAQRYKEIVSEILNSTGYNTEIAVLAYKKHKGWSNKMFVKPSVMPHRIRITDIKVERLQDISDEDCIKEGIMRWCDFTQESSGISNLYCYNTFDAYTTPRNAFAALIDRVSGKGAWESNPWVSAYTFELLK